MVLEQFRLANQTGHSCLANLPSRFKLGQQGGDCPGFDYIHLIEHFFTSNIKLFATHFYFIFREKFDVDWLASDFKDIFRCCVDDRIPEEMMNSLDGMLIGHRARCGELETRRGEDE